MAVPGHEDVHWRAKRYGHVALNNVGRKGAHARCLLDGYSLGDTGEPGALRRLTPRLAEPDGGGTG